MKRKVSMVERAILAQRWHESAIEAQIHALIGNSARNMVNNAGRVLFVALGAAILENMTGDEPDIRIIRGAVNALDEQADQEEITEARRAAIQSGLEAAQRILAWIPRKSVVDAVVDLEGRLADGWIGTDDFKALTARVSGSTRREA